MPIYLVSYLSTNWQAYCEIKYKTSELTSTVGIIYVEPLKEIIKRLVVLILH